MLCDDLLSDAKLPALYDGLDGVYERIRAARKFVFSKEFAIAADGLVDNYHELGKIGPWCRLPFPATWIEWLHDDRPHWDENGPYQCRPVDRSRHQFRPRRVGLLLEQDGSASCWRSHLFWSLRETSTPDGSLHNGSLTAVRFDTEDCDESDDPLVAATHTELADFGNGLLSELIVSGNIDTVKRLGQYAMEDWGGELRFMISALGLLNTRNVAETTPV